MITEHRIRCVLGVGTLIVAGLFSACKPDSPTEPVQLVPGAGEERFSVTLEWDAPSEDAEGRPLTDLAGYRVHYRRTSPADGPGGRSLDVGDATQVTIANLAEGSWYFAVTARDASDNYSGLSDELRIEVQP